MTKVNPNYGNQTKLDIFQKTFKSDIIFHLLQNTKKYFSDFL